MHVNCALWSAEVFEDDLGHIQQLQEAYKRARLLKCSGCGENGATVGCCRPKCNRNYHFGCAVERNALFGLKEVRNSNRKLQKNDKWFYHAPDLPTCVAQVYCKEHRDYGREHGRLPPPTLQPFTEQQVRDKMFTVDRVVVSSSMVLGLGESVDEFGHRARPTRAALDTLNSLLPTKAPQARQVTMMSRPDDRIDPNEWYLRRGAFVVVNFGTIDWHRPAYHTAKALYPVGYIARRAFYDIMSPFRIAVYQCSVLRSSDKERPYFQVSGRCG